MASTRIAGRTLRLGAGPVGWARTGPRRVALTASSPPASTVEEGAEGLDPARPIHQLRLGSARPLPPGGRHARGPSAVSPCSKGLQMDIEKFTDRARGFLQAA